MTLKDSYQNLKTTINILDEELSSADTNANIELANRIITYYMSNRGVGHTSTAISGLQNVPNAIFVVENDRAFSDMPKLLPKSNRMTAEQFMKRSGGVSAPVILDHFVTTSLLHSLLTTVANLRLQAKRLKELNEIEYYSHVNDISKLTKSKSDLLYNKNREIESLHKQLSEAKASAELPKTKFGNWLRSISANF